MVIIPYRFRDKDELRKWLWKYLSDYHLTMVPRPCFARVPGFKATEVAVRRLLALDIWQTSGTVLTCANDVTFEVRREALKAGKVLIVPIPRSGDAWRLEGVDPTEARPAAMIKEIERFATRLPLADIGPVPLMVIGALSVDRFGGWLGQGEIFGELAATLTSTEGLLKDSHRIALVDDMQIFEDFGYLRDSTDAEVDQIVTKTQVFAPEPRPAEAAHQCEDNPLQIL